MVTGLLAHFLRDELGELLGHFEVETKSILGFLLAQLGNLGGHGSSCSSLRLIALLSCSSLHRVRLGLARLEVVSIDSKLLFLSRSFTICNEAMHSERLERLECLLLDARIHDWVVVLVVAVLT